MRDVDGVEQVSQAQPNPDRSALLISVQLARDQEDASALQDVTKRVQADHPDLQVREAGDLSIDAGINDRVADDLSSAEGISLPVTLVLMLLAFGALIAAGIPVLLAATSVAATIGITAPLSHLVHAEATVEQHDRADRHGRRASTTRCSTSSASARNAPPGAAPSTPSRSPPRPRGTRSWCPVVRSSPRWPGCS